MMTARLPGRLLALPPVVPLSGGREGPGRPPEALPVGNRQVLRGVPCGGPTDGVVRALPQEVSGTALPEGWEGQLHDVLLLRVFWPAHVAVSPVDAGEPASAAAGRRSCPP